MVALESCPSRLTRMWCLARRASALLCRRSGSMWSRQMFDGKGSAKCSCSLMLMLAGSQAPRSGPPVMLVLEACAMLMCCQCKRWLARRAGFSDSSPSLAM
eukprot:747895-Hanusia_phi.AAC.6